MCPYYIPKSTAYYLKNYGHKNKFKKGSKLKIGGHENNKKS
jgi:hypothetical protein